MGLLGHSSPYVEEKRAPYDLGEKQVFATGDGSDPLSRDLELRKEHNRDE